MSALANSAPRSGSVVCRAPPMGLVHNGRNGGPGGSGAVFAIFARRRIWNSRVKIRRPPRKSRKGADLGRLAGAVHGESRARQKGSSKTGDLPAPGNSTQQTASLILDVDKDGLNDFVIAARQKAPSLVWFRRGKTGWTRYVIDKDLLPLEAGGTFADIDGDGDGKGNFTPGHLQVHLQPRIQGRRARRRRPPRHPGEALLVRYSADRCVAQPVQNTPAFSSFAPFDFAQGRPFRVYRRRSLPWLVPTLPRPCLPLRSPLTPRPSRHII